MKANKPPAKEMMRPDFGPRNWVTGRSLDAMGFIRYPGEGVVGNQPSIIANLPLTKKGQLPGKVGK